MLNLGVVILRPYGASAGMMTRRRCILGCGVTRGLAGVVECHLRVTEAAEDEDSRGRPGRRQMEDASGWEVEEGEKRIVVASSTHCEVTECGGPGWIVMQPMTGPVCWGEGEGGTETECGPVCLLFFYPGEKRGRV